MIFGSNKLNFVYDTIFKIEVTEFAFFANGNHLLDFPVI